MATKKPPKPKKAPKPKAPKHVRAPHALRPSTVSPTGTAKGTSVYKNPAAGALAGAASLVDLRPGSSSIGGSIIGSALLDLAGTGDLSLASALAAWQREQDRIANRAWRRPGGMQRMGLV